MSLYDFDTEKIGEQLLPPQLRQPKQLSWIKTLLYPIQWIRDNFFNVFIGGSTDPAWSALVIYYAGDRVKFSDKGVYECLYVNINKPPNLNTDIWIKLQDVFIGVDERLKYNSQIIVYEYALNRWLEDATVPERIFISNNATSSDAMLMANTSELSSTMANNSAFANYYMGNTYSPATQFDYTIYVPIVLFNSLGATTQDRENAVRNVADKYNMAGMQYSVETY